MDTWLNFPQPCDAKCFSAKIEQPGGEAAPNKCTRILYTEGFKSRPPFSHQRNLNLDAPLWNWWKILSMSHIMATGPFLNLQRTPAKVFVRSGPVKRWLFMEVSWKRAEQSNMFPGLWGWQTPWCELYHAGWLSSSGSGIFSASPRVIMSFMKQT